MKSFLIALAFCAGGAMAYEVVDTLSENLTPVQGQILIGDDPCPVGGVISFERIGDSDEIWRCAFTTDGKYEATTNETGDGLPPGEYRVVIGKWSRSPESCEAEVYDSLPDEYQACEIVIGPEATGVFKINFVVPLQGDSGALAFGTN